MAISKEDYHDIKSAHGKALAKKISATTRDRYRSGGLSSGQRIERSLKDEREGRVRKLKVKSLTKTVSEKKSSDGKTVNLRPEGLSHRTAKLLKERSAYRLAKKLGDVPDKWNNVLDYHPNSLKGRIERAPSKYQKEQLL